MDPYTKDLIQVTAWVVGILGGLVGVFRALAEFRRSREQRVAELRSRKAALAREFVRELEDDERIQTAMRLLDWSGREYQLETGAKVRITHDQMDHALRPGYDTFNDIEVKVRDCFDKLFDAFEQIEHYLRAALLVEGDIKYPLDYWVRELAKRKPIVQAYLESFEYALAISLLDRFDAWNVPKLRSPAE